VRISWRHSGWLPFLAVLIFGKAIVPLVLIMTADSVVAVMLVRALRRYRNRGQQGCQGRASPRVTPRITGSA
jgi:hypothetical protein